MNRSLILGLALGSALTTAAFALRTPAFVAFAGAGGSAAPAAAPARSRVYDNTLTPMVDPKPLLADFPQYVEPVVELKRYEAARLVDDADADLEVRAWRFSYNARGVIEMPNRLRARDTAVIMVHPWAVDDAWGWKTPEPSGVIDFCTPEKNRLAYRHTQEVITPFINRLRGKVACVVFSLTGKPDPVRTKVYRSFDKTPTDEERGAGRRELLATLAAHPYRGKPLPAQLTLSEDRPVADYFRKFPGLDAGPGYNGPGYRQLPVAVSTAVEVAPTDVVAYDEQGYPALRAFLRANGVRHVLLTGYATDMCFCKTTAGYENLSPDFNVFLVGDATLATFPANATPRFATNAHVSFAALSHLITQVNWVREAR